MREALFLVLAALLESGGDALVRWGLRGGRLAGFILGAITLFVYGLAVNLPKWDFSRLMGVYIAVFFVVSQAISLTVFHERLKPPIAVGGLLVIAGGLVMTLWHSS